MFTQSFFSGVMRCGGIGTRRDSDLSRVFWAAADAGGNRGASVVVVDGSASIISSSSSSLSVPALGFGKRDSEKPSGRSAVSVMSSISSLSLSLSWVVEEDGSEGVLGFGTAPFLRVIFLRFFLWICWEVSPIIVLATTILCCW